MKHSPFLHKGFLEARAITRTHAKTFYLASLFLPKEKRLAAYCLYAFCRISDDTIDTHGTRLDFNSLPKLLASLYDAAPPEEALLAALRLTVSTYGIKRRHFEELLAGLAMDRSIRGYRSFADLYTYCYRVAAVIGLMMLPVLGTRDEEKAGGYAIDLGVAMQLTNILRDIGEDLGRGRLYLPEDELRQFGLCRGDIERHDRSQRFAALMKFQIARARALYRRAQPGIGLITDRRCRFVVHAMSALYAAILDAIEKNGYNVYTQRCAVPLGRKLALLLSIALRKSKDSGS